MDYFLLENDLSFYERTKTRMTFGTRRYVQRKQRAERIPYVHFSKFLVRKKKSNNFMAIFCEGRQNSSTSKSNLESSPWGDEGLSVK